VWQAVKTAKDATRELNNSSRCDDGGEKQFKIQTPAKDTLDFGFLPYLKSPKPAINLSMQSAYGNIRINSRCCLSFLTMGANYILVHNVVMI